MRPGRVRRRDDLKHRALGRREDSPARPRGGRILWSAGPAAVPKEVLKEMADVAYVLVFAGGFVLLALVLRGLERL